MRTIKRRPPAPPSGKPIAVQIRGSLEWKRWLGELASLEDDSVSQFLARLAHQYAHRHGFPQPPRR